MRCYSSRRSADGFRKRAYTAEEIDALAAYCPELDLCYFVPMSELEGQLGIQLRLAPARNNQGRGIRWASAYEFDARLTRSGAIAQLGERLHGMQEVAGSSPAGSIALSD